MLQLSVAIAIIVIDNRCMCQTQYYEEHNDKQKYFNSKWIQHLL